MVYEGVNMDDLFEVVFDVLLDIIEVILERKKVKMNLKKSKKDDVFK